MIPHSPKTLRSLLDARIDAYLASRTQDWRQLEEPETREIEFGDRPIVLLGAGSVIAQDFVSVACERFRVVAAIDNARVGERRYGVEFVSDAVLPGLMQREPRAVAVMCCASDGAVEHFARGAEAAGLPVLSLFQARRRIGTLGWGAEFGQPDLVARLAAEAPALADELSVRTYLCMLLHRLSWSRTWLDQMRLLYRDMYFGTGIYPVTGDEILVDAGAYDGDSIVEFDRFSGRSARRILAFEPDATNAGRLRAAVADRPEVEVYEAGLWSATTTLSFAADGALGSRAAETGGATVQVRALDDLALDELTLVKLDIEGAEVPALQGARRTIARLRPKLAICAYHRPDDFLEIARAISEIEPSYRLYLRHHSPWLTDSVFYAVA